MVEWLRHEDGTRGHPLFPGSRSAGTRYGLAVVAALAGTLVTAALFQTTVSDQPIYAPMIGAVALTAWYGGFGPRCWRSRSPGRPRSGCSWTLTRGSPRAARERLVCGSTSSSSWRFAGLGGLLRLRGERAAVDASSARDAVQRSSRSSTCRSPSPERCRRRTSPEVVTGSAGKIVSARGVALAVVDGDELAVVESTGLAAEGRSHGDHLDLDASSLLAQGRARTAEVVTAAGRAELEGDFHDTATTLPARPGAIAVPLRSRDHLVGSLDFLFDRADAVGEDTISLAVIIGDLRLPRRSNARGCTSGSASHEPRSIASSRSAPRFLADDADDVIQAICREARRTFGADVSVLWRIRDDELVALAIDPPQGRQAGAPLSLEDFPRLRGAMIEHEASFVADALDDIRGCVFASFGISGSARRCGLRSSSRVGASSSSRCPGRSSSLSPIRRLSSSSVVLPIRLDSRSSRSSAGAHRRKWPFGLTRRAGSKTSRQRSHRRRRPST